MGPLAGPAAEVFARTLAREGRRVAMLYGPADLACLHRFCAEDGEQQTGRQGDKETRSNGGGEGSGFGVQGSGASEQETRGHGDAETRSNGNSRSDDKNGNNGGGNGDGASGQRAASGGNGGVQGSGFGVQGSGNGGNNGHNGDGGHNGGVDERVSRELADAGPCDMLLLPDWVFQFDLWPMSRGVHSICLSYGAGSEGLMGAYGALKSLIARFGRPEELLLLPFGCNEQEETWVRERLSDMCRRFLDLEPRLAHEKPDVHVHASKLLPIDGGSEGVKRLLAATGQPILTLVPRGGGRGTGNGLRVTGNGDRGTADQETRRHGDKERRPEEKKRSRGEEEQQQEGTGDRLEGTANNGQAARRETDPGGETEGPAMADNQVADVEAPAELTRLVPVESVPRDGEAVLRALIEHRQADRGGYFDIWSRQGVAGAVLGAEGVIGAAGEIRDLLGFGLWLCRQAKVNDLDELTFDHDRGARGGRVDDRGGGGDAGAGEMGAVAGV